MSTLLLSRSTQRSSGVLDVECTAYRVAKLCRAITNMIAVPAGLDFYPAPYSQRVELMVL
eukprot:6213769-Pleurochrysis_carterae.AAC.1